MWCCFGGSRSNGSDRNSSNKSWRNGNKNIGVGGSHIQPKNIIFKGCFFLYLSSDWWNSNNNYTDCTPNKSNKNNLSQQRMNNNNVIYEQQQYIYHNFHYKQAQQRGNANPDFDDDK